MVIVEPHIVIEPHVMVSHVSVPSEPEHTTPVHPEVLIPVHPAGVGQVTISTYPMDPATFVVFLILGFVVVMVILAWIVVIKR